MRTVNDIELAVSGDDAEYKKIKGLTESEAEEARRLYGSNRFTEKKRKGFFRRFLRELGDPIIRILLCALAVTLFLPGGEGGNLDAIGIAAAVLIATLVSTACECGSERAFSAMQREAGAQLCRAIRSGTERVVTVGEIVVGDVIRLRAGERVPADGVLIEGIVSCDLSALNGESVEQRKYAQDSADERGVEGTVSEDRLGDRSSLFRGSEITAGDGIMRVTAVGDSTYYGKMAGELQEEGGDSPLKMKLSKLAGTLSKFGYFCAFAVGISNFLFSTFFSAEFVFSFSSLLSAFLKALTLSVSVVVMAVPEGLPMMITVVLASNMFKMQREHVLVRKPVGIETAGSINILFTDKTGTLTYGKPQVNKYVYSGGESEKALGLPEEIRRLNAMVTSFVCGDVTDNNAYSLATCASSSSVGRGRKKKRKRTDVRNNHAGAASSAAGDSADVALKNAFSDAYRYVENMKRVAYLPFSSTEKLSAAAIVSYDVGVNARGREGDCVIIKGAPEVLLERCEYEYTSDGSVKKINREALRGQLNALASRGLRVIAAVRSDCGSEAVRKAARAASGGERIDAESLFCRAAFISFICLRDNLRKEAADAIAELHGAGVQTVMITGDNPLTAEAIAREAGIIPKGSTEAGEVLTGSELSAMSDSQLSELLPRIRVIARALPQDKSRLVRIASARGMVVGMTGDGLNDAPALKQADVGFAMGSGTDVAKEAGDIVISDNNIASIVKAVHYGRTIFKSIRKFIVFQLTMNLCAVGISIICPFIGYESPISVMQMLWINIIIDTLAALAFAGEPPLPSYMRERPIPKDARVLSSEMLTKIFTLGVYTLMLCIYFLISPRTVSVFGGDGGEARMLTGFFALFIFSGLLGSLNARTNGLNPFGGLGLNPVFVAVMSGVFTAQIAMIYYGGSFFDTVPLKLNELFYVLSLAVTVIPAGRLYQLASYWGKSEGRIMKLSKSVKH